MAGSGSTTPANVVDRRAAQVRRLLESRTLQHADALKRLLDYLAKQALENNAVDLKEYTVGLEAFGKPADYNPQLDSSVRVQAGKLRQKLDEYYRTDGAADDLVVSLPKGHFKLEFHERPTAAIVSGAETAGEPVVATSAPPRAGFWQALWPSALTSAVVLIALAGFVFLYPRTPRAAPASAWTPEMEELWKPFLSSPRPLMVAIGTPLFVKIGGNFFRDPTINNSETLNNAERVRELRRVIGGDTATASIYTGIGEAEGAFELGRLLLARSPDMTIRASSQLTWEDIDRYNMIFLGSPKYAQQTLDLPVRQDFEISRSQVQNLHPAPGEPAAFEERFSADHVHLDEGHALISRLPGLHRTGEILVLAGSSTESTRAAAEFVTRPEYVSSWVKQLHGHGDLPQWFQLVVHVRYKSNTPIAIEPVALHAIH